MAETLKLTNRNVLKIHEGLAALDGVADKDGSVLRFELEANTVWLIAQNRVAFEQAVEKHNRARKLLGAKHGIVERMRITDENAPRVAKYMDDCETLLDETQEVSGIIRLDRAELQRNGNRIPSGAIANLIPILKQK